VLFFSRIPLELKLSMLSFSLMVYEGSELCRRDFVYVQALLELVHCMMQICLVLSVDTHALPSLDMFSA